MDGVTGLVISALGGVLAPSGLIEMAAVVAVTVLLALVTRLAVAVAGQWRLAPSPVPVRAGARPLGRSTAADTPGRPQPRAPGGNGSRD